MGDRNTQRRRVDAAWRRRLGVACVLAAFAALSLSVARVVEVGFSSRNNPASSAPTPESLTASVAKSPFAPWDEQDRRQRNAAAEARTAGMKLVGVRVAEETAQSGVILRLEDGAERAFAVGEDVAPGVQLAQVRAGSAVLSFEGGERVLRLEPGPHAAAASEALSGDAAAGDALAADEAHAWLVGMLSEPHEAAVARGGWLVSAAPAPSLAAAGLRAGDLILTINGVAPPADASVLSGATQVGLTVQRADGQRVDIFVAAGTGA